MSEQRLTAIEMARFVADGFLAFPAVVPETLNRTALAQLEDERLQDTGYRGERFGDRYRGLALEAVFALPRIAGAISSLIGPDPIFDHHALHVQGPGSGAGAWHQDAVIDAKMHFDIQLMYFPQDTTLEMGGTMLLPGSHFRRVNVFEIGRYQNFLGQVATVCPAGTILATHHGMWHTARANRTAIRRLMFKVRLAASVPQVRLFDLAGYDSSDVHGILGREHAWTGSDGRLEIIHRIKLWRLLTGDARYDLGYWLGRIENDPFRSTPDATRRWRIQEEEARAAAAVPVDQDAAAPALSSAS